MGKSTAPASLLCVSWCATALTTTGGPISATAAAACSALATNVPAGTGIPWARRKAFASGSVSAVRPSALAAAITLAKSPGLALSIAAAPGSMIDAQDDLAELLCRFEVAMRFGRLREGKHTIDDGLQLAVVEERHHYLQIMLGGAVGADDRQLLVEDVVHEHLAIVGLGAADRDDPAAPGQAADRLVEEIAADMLDDEVDAALVCALQNLVDEIRGVVVDDLVGPQFLGPLQLPVGARGRVDKGACKLADLDGRHAHARACGVDQHCFARA